MISFNKKETSFLQDAKKQEKHASSAYNTAIFEFCGANIREILTTCK